jgi:hypothetical protein
LVISRSLADLIGQLSLISLIVAIAWGVVVSAGLYLQHIRITRK